MTATETAATIDALTATCRTTLSGQLCDATYADKKAAALAYRDEMPASLGLHPLDPDGGRSSAHTRHHLGGARMRAAQDAMSLCDIRGIRYGSVREAMIGLGWYVEGDLAEPDRPTDPPRPHKGRGFRGVSTRTKTATRFAIARCSSGPRRAECDAHDLTAPSADYAHCVTRPTVVAVVSRR